MNADIEPYLEIHDRKINEVFPWTWDEFEYWLRDSNYAKNITIMLPTGETLILDPRCDSSVPYEINWGNGERIEGIYLLFMKDRIKKYLGIFFKDDRENVSLFLNKLESVILELPFVQDVEPYQFQNYLKKTTKQKEKYYDLNVRVTPGMVVDISCEGLRTLKKTIGNKLTGITDTYKDFTLLAAGKVMFRDISMKLQGEIDPDGEYWPKYKINIILGYFIIPNDEYFAPDGIGYYKAQLNFLKDKPEALRKKVREIDEEFAEKTDIEILHVFEDWIQQQIRNYEIPEV